MKNLKENELKQYFKESKGLEKDLSPFIMNKIAQESKTTFQPVDLPKPLFWGITILLMGIFSLVIPQLERGKFNLWKSLDIPDVNLSLNTIEVNPILLIASLTVFLCVWIVVLFEKRWIGE